MNKAGWDALGLVFLDPQVWITIPLAAVYGIFVGAVPGLTATMAVALFVPLAYWMQPVPALAAIVTMTACAIFAGDIPTTLLRIPGTPASAAYADDAYYFTRRGRSQTALGTGLLSSVLGGLGGAVVLMVLGAQLAWVATSFSAAEYFWLYLLGLSCAVVVTQGSVLKAMFGLLLGLLFSTVGLSPVHASARFTFGQAELLEGISFIPAMIGLFGISEVLGNLLREPTAGTIPPQENIHSSHRKFISFFSQTFAPAWQMVKQRKTPLLRSTGIGALIGMLPGAGADIAAWVSLAVSKKSSTPGMEESQQRLQGLSDASTANSAALAGGWIPALVFGIPGDSVTAIVIGVLMMKNVKPGPEIFEKDAALVYSIYILFVLANLLMLPIGLLAIKAAGLVVRVPQNVLLPIIVLFCTVGSFAIKGSYFDVGIMLLMGVLGWLLDQRQVPLGAIVLGIILGGPLEERFVQTLTTADGSWLAFVNRPVSLILGIFCLLLWTWTLARHLLAWNKTRTASISPGN